MFLKLRNLECFSDNFFFFFFGPTKKYTDGHGREFQGLSCCCRIELR